MCINEVLLLLKRFSANHYCNHQIWIHEKPRQVQVKPLQDGAENDLSFDFLHVDDVPETLVLLQLNLFLAFAGNNQFNFSRRSFDFNDFRVVGVQ